MATFGQRLKSLRIEKGIQQGDLAKSLGMGRSTLEKYENDRTMPPEIKQKYFADYFGVSVEYLRGETDGRGDGFEIHAHREPGTPGISLTDALDIVDRLERLTKLRDSGAITDEEFAQAKRKLLK